MNDIELCQELMKRTEEYQKRKEREFAIVELEKIKAEIEVLHNNYKINIQGYSMSVARECMDIIDNHIKELKGEQNE